MSAYGAILGPLRSADLLPSTIWKAASKRTSEDENPRFLTIHHLTLSSALALPGLVQYLHGVFVDELERGMTYPQEIRTGEEYTQAMFESYYFAGDVLIAILGHGKHANESVDGSEIATDINDARQGREWAECIAGCYYVTSSVRYCTIPVPMLIFEALHR